MLQSDIPMVIQANSVQDCSTVVSCVPTARWTMHCKVSALNIPPHARSRTRACCRVHAEPCTMPPHTHAYRSKGWVAAQQLIRQHPHTPAVHLVAVACVRLVLVVHGMMLDRAVKDLRGQVVYGTQPTTDDTHKSMLMRMLVCDYRDT